MRLRAFSQTSNSIPKLLYCNINEIPVIVNIFILFIVQIKFINNKKTFGSLRVFFMVFIIKCFDD